MRDWIWLIPLLPFAGTLLNGVLLKDRLSKRAVTWVALGAVGSSLALALASILDYLRSAEYAAAEGFEKVLYLWIPAGPLAIGAEGASSMIDFNIEMGFLLDPLGVYLVGGSDVEAAVLTHGRMWVCRPGMCLMWRAFWRRPYIRPAESR